MTAHDDAARLRALIAEMRGIDAADTAEFDSWTDADVAKTFDNPESARLLRGQRSKLTPAQHREVERLARLADNET